MFNLLTVDDEKDTEILFKHFFRKEIQSGVMSLYFEPSAQKGLLRLKELEGHTIVLTDINMPDMSGLELLKQISISYPKIKVFLVSAYDKHKFNDDMQKYGAEGYVS
ncbi:MAG: response regulator, partial [Halobacteriovoraceae bacterium]|nr:response regulator [Halobacteriovoraceae bacterium]